MRAKFVSVFILIFIVFLAVLIWRVDQLIFQDKLSWNEAQSRAQLSAVVRALEVEQKSLLQSLAVGFSIVAEKNREFSEKSPFSKFELMAELSPPTAPDKKDWKISRKFFKEKTETQAWAEKYLTLAFGSLAVDMVPANGGIFLSLMDPKRKPYVLILSRAGSEAGEQWLLAVANLDAFQGIADRQKGQMSQVFVVNSRGEALGHTTPEYVGSLLAEDPLVAELSKSNVPSGSGIFSDLKGDQIQGFYEQVQNTNLYAVISTPVASLIESRESTWVQFALLGLGMCFVGVALFLLSVRNETPLPQRVLVTPSMPSGQTPGIAAGMGVHGLPPMPANPTGGEDKMTIYTKVASSLSHELNAPITAALGHAQIAKIAVSKVNPNAVSKIEKVEEDLRSAREILQKLLIFAGEDKYQESEQKLENVVARVLKNFESKLITKGIKLTKNLITTEAFKMSQELVMKAIENVLQNAIEAMERVPKKEVVVDMESAGDRIHVTITDTGEGIEVGDLEKVFDPFFTRRSHSKHSGLGLSATLGILSAMKGDVKISSERGKGTSVKLIFNPHASSEVADAPDLDTNPSSTLASVNLPPPPSPLLDPIVSPNPPKVREGSLSLRLRPTPKPPSQDSALMRTQQTSSQVDLQKLDEKTASKISSLVKESAKSADPFLSDNSLEKLIEGGPDAVEDISEKTIASDISIPSTLANEGMSSEKEKIAKPDHKIDRPKMKPKKTSSLTDEVFVAVRKPGEKA